MEVSELGTPTLTADAAQALPPAHPPLMSVVTASGLPPSPPPIPPPSGPPRPRGRGQGCCPEPAPAHPGDAHGQHGAQVVLGTTSATLVVGRTRHLDGGAPQCVGGYTAPRWPEHARAVGRTRRLGPGQHARSVALPCHVAACSVVHLHARPPGARCMVHGASKVPDFAAHTAVIMIAVIP